MGKLEHKMTVFVVAVLTAVLFAGCWRDDEPPHVNQPPTAYFTGATETTVGSPTVFDASSSYDPDGDPVSYSWSFGNGSSSTAQMVTHVFTNSGQFGILLTVTDTEGASDVCGASIMVYAEKD